MLIKKDTVLNVDDHRKGKYIGIALNDFDTEKDDFYPIAVHQEKLVKGLAFGNVWGFGDEIPARKGITFITIRENDV